MAVDAETHIDFVHRFNPIHSLNRAVTCLARHSSPDMRFVHEAHEIGKCIDAIPANLENWLGVVGPRPRYRLNPAEECAAMTADAALNWRNSGIGRPPRVLVAVLAGDFINAGMDAMAERNRLLDAFTGRPRPFRKRNHDNSTHEKEQRNGNQYAVHRLNLAQLRP